MFDLSFEPGKRLVAIAIDQTLKRRMAVECVRCMGMVGPWRERIANRNKPGRDGRDIGVCRGARQQIWTEVSPFRVGRFDASQSRLEYPCVRVESFGAFGGLDRLARYGA